MTQTKLLCRECKHPLKLIEDPWGKRLKCVKCRVETELDDEQFAAATEAVTQAVKKRGGENSGVPWDHHGLMGFLPTVLMVLFNRETAFSKMRKSGGVFSPFAFMFTAGVSSAVAGFMISAAQLLIFAPQAATLQQFQIEAGFRMLGPIVSALVVIVNAAVLHFLLANMQKLAYGAQATIRACALMYGSFVVAFIPLQLLSLIPEPLFVLLVGGCTGLMGLFIFVLMTADAVAIAQRCSMGKVVFAMIGVIALYSLPFIGLYMLLKSSGVLSQFLM